MLGCTYGKAIVLKYNAMWEILILPQSKKSVTIGISDIYVSENLFLFTTDRTWSFGCQRFDEEGLNDCITTSEADLEK